MVGKTPKVLEVTTSSQILQKHIGVSPHVGAPGGPIIVSPVGHHVVAYAAGQWQSVHVEGKRSVGTGNKQPPAVAAGGASSKLGQ
jgi:hypothetical protein